MPRFEACESTFGKGLIRILLSSSWHLGYFYCLLYAPSLPPLLASVSRPLPQRLTPTPPTAWPPRTANPVLFNPCICVCGDNTVKPRGSLGFLVVRNFESLQFFKKLVSFIEKEKKAIRVDSICLSPVKRALVTESVMVYKELGMGASWLHRLPLRGPG